MSLGAEVADYPFRYGITTNSPTACLYVFLYLSESHFT